MATLVTRSGKGSPLTHAEVDANFTNLNTDKLELSGGTMTGNLSFGDNDKAIFGAGSDLQIYHDGSNSYISDQGTGNIKILANDFRVKNAADTESLIQANQDGEVYLYYNNGVKLATTSTGIDVTGTVTADGLTVDTSTLHVDATNNRVGINTASPTQTLQIGDIGGKTFVIDQSTSNITRLANDRSTILEAGGGYDLKLRSDGNASFGNIIFETAGTTDRMKIAPNGDISFYEDTGTTAKFFWDASGESLGIGTSSPQQDIHIQSTATATVMAERTGATAGLIGIYGSNAPALVWGGNTDRLRFAQVDDASLTNFTERMTIDSSGLVGIGTSSPSAPLHIKGGGDIMRLESTGATGNLYIDFYDTTARKGYIGYGSSSTDDLQFYQGDTANMVFYTSGAERMRIDSSGNVGIGNTNPSDYDVNADNLVVGTTSGNNGISIASGTTGLGSVFFADATSGVGLYRGLIQYNHSSDYMRFFTTSAERMRIDSSGNLLVGKTTNDSNVVGAQLNANGTVIGTADGVRPAIFNRKTSDGDIISLRKDGTTVGSIGTQGGLLNIGNGDCGLAFSTNNDNIYPTNPSTSTNRDAAIDLGGGTVRFKDLYLSGGVYLGGTGAANKLDDYEEGTWTSSLQGSSTAGTWTPSGGTPNARYVKIGKVYFITFEISGSLSGASGEVQIRGLPTVSSANDQGWYATYWSGFNTAQIWIGGHLTASGDGMWVKGNTAAATEMGGVSVSELGTGTVVIRGVAVIEEI